MEANEYKLTIPAHPSIYDPKPREMEVFFCEPGAGINEETGLLLFIPGFGAHAESKVYKKMKRYFADKYNLVTVQCNYFGYEFMQNPDNVSYVFNLKTLKSIFKESELSQICTDGALDFDKLVEIGQNYKIRIEGREVLSENLANFNDMGVMQAVDCLTAVLVVTELIRDNGYDFNKGKVIAYGHSHGSFIAHLCNVFCPGLFTLIIDNSAWLLPEYLIKERHVMFTKGLMHFDVVFSYLAMSIDMDLEIRNLEFLYRGFGNRAKIICYQGDSDKLVDPVKKRNLISGLENTVFVKVDESMLDGKRFRSTGHGLDADFLALLEHSLESFFPGFRRRAEIPMDETVIETPRARYHFTYNTGVPVLEMKNISF
ncbi:MAG: DUF2920 family protein [Bacillota bacterium]